MPEVQSARDQGYELAPQDPTWVFLPALWPESERIWIPDTRVRYRQVRCQGELPQTFPWPAVQYFREEAYMNELLADCGVAPRPAGRLWLLRPPSGYSTLSALLRPIVESAEEVGIRVVPGRAYFEHVHDALDGVFPVKP